MKTDIYLGLIVMAIIINFYLFLYLANKRKKILTKEKELAKLNIDKEEFLGERIAHRNKMEKVNSYALELNDFADKLKKKVDEFNNMHTSVFYDTQNDTIVTFDNLEEIGEL